MGGSVNTATLIKEGLPDFTGQANLYRLDPPIAADDSEKGPWEYVVTSAVVAPYTGPETYIFASDENGEVVDWGELNGSYRGALDHEQALRNAGYEVG